MERKACTSGRPPDANAPAGAVAIISIAPSGVEVLGARNVIVEIRCCPLKLTIWVSENQGLEDESPLIFGGKRPIFKGLCYSFSSWCT